MKFKVNLVFPEKFKANVLKVSFKIFKFVFSEIYTHENPVNIVHVSTLVHMTTIRK